MFSDPAVVALVTSKFVAVKADPRASNFTAETMNYKLTQYVPEVVLLTTDLEVLGRLNGFAEADEAQQLLEAAIRQTNPGS